MKIIQGQLRSYNNLERSRRKLLKLSRPEIRMVGQLTVSYEKFSKLELQALWINAEKAEYMVSKCLELADLRTIDMGTLDLDIQEVTVKAPKEVVNFLNAIDDFLGFS